MPKLPNIKERFDKNVRKIWFTQTGGKGSHIRLKHADGRWTQVAVHPKPIPSGT